MQKCFPAIPCLLAFIASSSLANAQDELRWHFQRGEQIRYAMQQNIETVVKVGDNEVHQPMETLTDMVWNVLDVAANGDAVMNQMLSRVQVKIGAAPAAVSTFDTGNPQKSDNPFLNSMGETYLKVVNQNFTVSMKPTGEVGDVVIPKVLMELINASAAGNASALSEDTLKDMMKHSAVMLPKQRVSPSDSWTSQQTVQMPFGTMVIKSTMTFVQKDADGNAIIDIVPEIKITPREGAPVKMSLTDSSGQGRLTFDIARGRVTRSQLVLKMGMKIDTGQQVVNQTINNATSLTLIP